ncbi:MAG: hypothetical protein JST00_08095 [Deltaproteobacteria bacterium]|nr:hypothetical protein [Deltaproteobacteria bacterium]
MARSPSLAALVTSAMLLVSPLLPGCAAESGDEGDEEAAVVEEALGTFDPARPIVLHYGFLQDEAVPRSGAATTPNGALTGRLRVNGVENVIVTTAPPRSADVVAWGGRVAYRATPAEITKPTAAAAASWLRAKIDQGYHYVVLDEIEPSKSSGLADGTDGARALAAAMRALEADPRYRRRVVLMVNTYNMAGTARNALASYSTVLRACRDHCRVAAAEVYLAAREAFAPGAPSATTCDSGIRCIGYLANALDDIAPGIAKKTITILDVRGQGNLPGRSPGSYCWGDGGGALRAEIAKVRELGQPGVGFYALTYVAADLDGPAERATFDATVKKFAGCTRALLAERAWPRVPR